MQTPDKDAIRNRLCVILLTYTRRRKGEIALKPDDLIQSDLGLDSLDSIELVMDIEAEFGVTIPDSEWEAGPDRRVSDVVDLIATKLSGRA
jgi:acyl carrier protein